MDGNARARPWILADANYAYTKENPYDVAVLPLGATEPHNLHLPYGTDVFEGTVIGEPLRRGMWGRQRPEGLAGASYLG